MATEGLVPPRLAPPTLSQEAFTAVLWAGTALATVALAFRYYVRFKSFRRLLADDCIIGFAWCIFLAQVITLQTMLKDMYEIAEIGARLRMPTADLPKILSRNSKAQVAVVWLLYINFYAVKANFLVFFHKLGHQITYFRIAFWFITAFTFASFVASVAKVPYDCLLKSPEFIMANCQSEEHVNETILHLKLTTALDVSSEALIMALPISLLWNVRISLARRLTLAAVFGLVLITMITAILRVILVPKNGPLYPKQVETTWHYLWHIIESVVSLLVACLGSFRALFVSKEHDRHAVEAAENHAIEDQKDSNEKRNRVLNLRLKHFQHSLFDTVKTGEMTGTTLEGLDQIQCDSVVKLRWDSSTANESGVTASRDGGRGDSHELADLPDLNCHGLTNLSCQV